MLWQADFACFWGVGMGSWWVTRGVIWGTVTLLCIAQQFWVHQRHMYWHQYCIYFEPPWSKGFGDGWSVWLPTCRRRMRRTGLCSTLLAATSQSVRPTKPLRIQLTFGLQNGRLHHTSRASSGPIFEILPVTAVAAHMQKEW